MRLDRILATLMTTMLVACASALTATPTSAPTATATAAPTQTPTNVPTATPRPTETRAATPTATATTRPTATPTLTPCTTLRECAERKQFQIGNYFTGAQFRDAKWRDLVPKEFNVAVIASGFYWDEMEPVRGQFNYAFVDEQVAFAQSKNMTVVGHALLLGASPYIPGWLAQGNFSRDDLSQILRNYIVQVMNRYKGKISQYIVVEDPYPDDPGDIFYPKFGYDYIDLAFQIARETDKTALLIYNAGNNETSGGASTQLTRQTVQRLKSKGLIDGVGLEMHLDATKPYDKQDVIVTMESYGVPVYVTEIDVDLTNVQGTQEERYAKQATVYSDMFAACLESGVCKSFAVWGIGDKNSWLERGSASADPTLFDDTLNPKPAYSALLNALR